MRIYQKTALQKVGILVRAGMMEPPTWYAVAKQLPPFQRRPSNGVEVLKLPWDTLANEFISRNPHMVEDPEWLGPGGFQPGAPPISHVFAKRQFALMQNGIKKEDAYERTHAAMKKERAEDVAAVQRMVREASSMAGGRPSFVSDDDVYAGLRFWQSMMKETPYADWDLAAKEGLDLFLRRELIGWDDDRVKLAQSAKDGTVAALKAELHRLRVSLFPETKSTEYAFPSDVVRPRDGEDMEEEDSYAFGEAEEGDEASGADNNAAGEEKPDLAREGSEDWKAARLNSSWKATLQCFEEMTEEAGYELDWSAEDRRSLDNFIVGRCIRRSILEEAFNWIPDPIADALARAKSVKTPAATAAGGAEGAAAPAAAEADAQEAGSADDDDGSERWLSGGELAAFTGDWLALARRRTGRPEIGISAAAAAAAAAAAGRVKGRRRGVEMARNVGAVANRPNLTLESNLVAVLAQAKRQLLPNLVLAVDEKAGPMSAEERRARDAAKKKIVMADIEWEQEEITKQREAVTQKMMAGINLDEMDPIAALRKKRLAKGVWKAERRRLLALEKKMYRERQEGFGDDDDKPKYDAPELIEDVVESEVVRRKADEFYAKEKARMKREAKLKAAAAAEAAAAKAEAKAKA